MPARTAYFESCTVSQPPLPGADQRRGPIVDIREIGGDSDTRCRDDEEAGAEKPIAHLSLAADVMVEPACPGRPAPGSSLERVVDGRAELARRVRPGWIGYGWLSPKPRKNQGVPGTFSAVASVATAAISLVTAGLSSVDLDLRGVEPGHLRQDLVDQRVGDPAGILSPWSS